MKRTTLVPQGNVITEENVDQLRMKVSNVSVLRDVAVKNVLREIIVILLNVTTVVHVSRKLMVLIAIALLVLKGLRVNTISMSV